MKATMGMSYRLMENEINRMNQEMFDLRNKAATGKKISKPSDDPAAIRPILSFKSQIQRSDKFQSNISIAKNRLEIFDTKVGQVANSLMQIKELAIRAENGAYDQANKDTLADQVSLLHDEILDIANSQVNGKYIFAGFSDTTKPFVVNDNGVVDFQGDMQKKELEISPGETMQVSLSGEKFLMGKDDTDKDGLVKTSGTNIFREIKKIELAMRGHEGQIVDASGKPISTNEYLDGDPETGVQRLVDDSGEPILDDDGKQITFDYNGEPIYLTKLRDTEGNIVKIGDLENPENYNIDSASLEGEAEDKAVYIHRNGDIAKYDKAGEPILADESGSNPLETESGNYVSLLADGQPMQKMYIPELTDQLKEIDDSSSQVSRYRGIMGNYAARVDRASEQLTESLQDTKTTLSQYEDADIIKVYSDIVQQETTLKAALNVTSRVARLSILNYL